ncbi:thiamine-phosphate kinase [Caldiplasma sukawensis]
MDLTSNGKLSERELIDLIYSKGFVKEPKDDCSWLERKDEYIFITTDSITLKTHIPDVCSPYEAGKFFGSINLSDIAAMGATPESFMASYVIGKNTDTYYIKEFVEGLHHTLEKFTTDYIGGDTKSGDSTIFTGICIGNRKKNGVTFRSNIKKGQVLCVTNQLGSKGASYLLYSMGVDKVKNGKNIIDIIPRVNEGIKIADSGARFMMDLSDGLFGAIYQMKRDYGFGFRIIKDQIPLSPEVGKAKKITGKEEMEIINYGGDYELLFTIEQEDYSKFVTKMEDENIKISYIGDIWDGDNLLFDGERWNKINFRGWEHFL